MASWSLSPTPSCDDQKFPHCQISPAGKKLSLLKTTGLNDPTGLNWSLLQENPGCSDVLHIAPLSVTSVLPALVGEQ